MTDPNFRLRVPGKLMIAGEYAVLERNQQAIVTAVDRYVTITVTSHKKHRLDLPDLGIQNVTWRDVNGEIHFDLEDSRLDFIKRAMSVVYQYVEEPSVLRRPFHLIIESELDNRTGKKYGLGSSAAVVTGVVTALLKIAKKEEKFPGSDLIFKLAAIAHFQAQGSGSGTDVAASTYGGWLSYTSFYPDWLSERLASGDPLHKIIDAPWPFFSVTRLAVPTKLVLCVGWTGKPASTKSLIQNVQKLWNLRRDLYRQFLQESERAVSKFAEGARKGNSHLLLAAIVQNRAALQKLGRYADVPIETLRLATLANLAIQHGGAGKPSGAGAGDCGVALVPESEVHSLQIAWREVGIDPLAIRVANTGVSLIEESLNS